MEIFIGNLPSDVTVHDVHCLFCELARENSIQIFRKSKRGGGVTCYGVAVVEPDEQAQAIIERLRDAQVLGQAVVVRRFLRRTGADRRTPDWTENHWDGQDRRVTDRRGAL